MTGHAVVGIIIAKALRFLSDIENPKMLEHYAHAAVQFLISRVAA